MAQAAGGIMVSARDTFMAHFGPLGSNWTLLEHHSVPKHCCWPCLSLYDPSDVHFQQEAMAPYHKNQLISKWFFEPDNELKWPPWSPNNNPIDNLRDMVWNGNGRSALWMWNWQIWCNCVMSVWTEIHEECFQHFFEFMSEDSGVQSGTRFCRRQQQFPAESFDLIPTKYKCENVFFCSKHLSFNF